MSTIHTKKVGDVFQPVAIEEDEAYDPFSEYTHSEKDRTTSSAQEQQITPTTRPKQELFDNVDKMFEGANLVFDLANHFMKHLNRRK